LFRGQFRFALLRPFSAAAIIADFARIHDKEFHMCRRRVALVIVLTLVLVPFAVAADAPPASPAPDQPAAIDWNRARDLYQRSQRGEKLSAEDQAYLDRAKAERAKGRPQGNNPAGGGGGRADVPPARESTGMVPLSNADGADYKGNKLGLYGDGQNAPPAEHLKRAQAAAAKVVPLDAKGQTAADGKVVLMSVGMSNTTQEFSRFVQIAKGDAGKARDVVVVDAAQGGRAADDWASARRTQTWEEADRRLGQNGVTPQQVQVLWVKQARKGPASLGEFPAHARALEADLKNIVLLAKQRYPNLRLVYLSSRTYAGYAVSPLNPEPYAYESAFSVQWLIRSQATGEDKDLAGADVPALLWGPYLWTDGTKGRGQDKLVWEKADTANDGTHPSRSGQQKVAELLLEFFKTDPTAKGWFTGR
jgi:hypothetical protein